MGVMVTPMGWPREWVTGWRRVSLRGVQSRTRSLRDERIVPVEESVMGGGAGVGGDNLGGQARALTNQGPEVSR